MPGLTLWLVLGVLLLPTCAALLARALEGRSGARIVQLIGALGFAGAIACLVALQWRPLDEATLGRLTIFLPSSDVVVAQDSYVEIPTAMPTAKIATATPTRTAAPTRTPTATATATPEPTPTSPPPPTEIPPTAAPPPTEVPPPPPPPTSPPQQVRRYVVQSGDTLRGIAEQFNVSVGAILRYNGLSAEDGDNLRPGQELLIPPP